MSDKSKTRTDTEGDAQARQKRLLRRQHEARKADCPGLRPDDIGVVRVEFSVPASRLFDADSFIGGGSTGGRTVDNDGDPNDDILIFDSDTGPNGDEVLQVPWPPGSDPD